MLIEICSADSTALAVVDTHGAQLKSFKNSDGEELLWQGNPEFWAGQAPVLFPIVGALRNGRVKIKGEWHEMRRHGFAKSTEFTVTEKTASSVTLKIEASRETKEIYPFDFSFSVTYTCGEKSLETKFDVTNTGNEILPYSVGGHPAYNVPVGYKDGEVFEDYQIEFSENENQKCPEIDLKECLINPEKVTLELNNERIIPLRHSLFYRDALVFDKLNSKTVKLVNTKNGRGIGMDISGFPMLGIWSCVNDGPYVALEPWTGCATLTTEDDEFEHKKNTIFLPCGETRSYAFTTYYF